jgi:cyclase
MKKTSSLGWIGILCALLCCSVVMALDTPATSDTVASSELRKISDHVYSYLDEKNPAPGANSFGANAGVIVGRDAALVVDTLISAKEGHRLLNDVRKITDKPIKYVVNTHYHLDHAWGNCVFAREGAVIIAQENALHDMDKSKSGMSHPEEYGMTALDLEGTTLTPPTIVFPDHMSVDLGGLTVELQYYGITHTDDSITVYVPRDKVLFAGDIVFNRYHPFMDGDIVNWQKALGKLMKVDATTIVPGHGPIATKTDLEDLRVYLAEFDKQAKALCAGKKADDAPAIAAKIIGLLPQQHRDRLTSAIESNLRSQYLPHPSEAK